MPGGKLLVPWYKYPPFSPDRIGGLSVIVWELTGQLAARGVSVDIATPEDNAEDAIAPGGVRILRSALGQTFLQNKPLKEEERRPLDEYDAILSIANYAAGTFASCKRTGCMVMRQIHAVAQDRGLDTYVSLAPNAIEYFKMVVAKRRDERNMRLLTGSKTLCVSEYVRCRMQGELESSENLQMIPNGIQSRKFKPTGERKEYDILVIGRFQKSKGLDILLRAVSLIAGTKGEVLRLAIVGDFSGKQRTFLLQGVTRPVRDRIIFLGSVKREDLPSAINRAKLVAVPSRYESFGLPALEAIACGVPVIASRVGGLPEIIDDSVGALVEPEDPQALALAIYELLQAPALAEKVARTGPERASRYDWDRIAARLQAAIFP